MRLNQTTHLLVPHPETGSGGVVLLDTDLHPDTPAELARLAESLRRDGRSVFQASARPAQRPFDLVSRTFGGTLHQGTDTVASARYAPVSERTDLSLLPREIVAQFSVVSEILASLAQRAAVAPVLVVLEDLQWADQADITFATRLLTYTKTSPIWFIATHRRGHPSVRLVHFLEAASARQSECECAADLCPGAS